MNEHDTNTTPPDTPAFPANQYDDLKNADPETLGYASRIDDTSFSVDGVWEAYDVQHENNVAANPTIHYMSIFNAPRTSKWKNDARPFRNLVSEVLTHRSGAKEGPAVVWAIAKKGITQRNASNVEAVTALTLDIDDGGTIDGTIRRLRELGYTALLYSSHSHDVGILRREKVLARRDADDGNEDAPDDAEVLSALQDHFDWFDPDTHRWEVDPYDGEKYVVYDAPIEKFRIVLPLAKPFYLNSLKDRQTSIDRFSDMLRALANALDVEIDTSCVDIARLFYTARHREGVPWRSAIVYGANGLFDHERDTAHLLREYGIDEPAPSSVKPSGKADRAAPTAKRKGRQEGATGRYKRPSMIEGRKVSDIPFATLDLPRLIRDHAPDTIETEQGDEGFVMRAYCPLVRFHGSGDPSGTSVRLTDLTEPSARDGRSYWKCQHAGCGKHSTRDFVLALAEENEAFAAALFDPEYDLMHREATKVMAAADVEPFIATAALYVEDIEHARAYCDIVAKRSGECSRSIIARWADARRIVLEAEKAACKDSGRIEHLEARIGKLWHAVPVHTVDELANLADRLKPDGIEDFANEIVRAKVLSADQKRIIAKASAQTGLSKGDIDAAIRDARRDAQVNMPFFDHDEDGFLINSKSEKRITDHPDNIALAVEKLGCDIWYDAFRAMPMIDGLGCLDAFDPSQAIDDAVYNYLHLECRRRFEIGGKYGDFCRILETLSLANWRHVVREHFDECEAGWDGLPRLDTFLIDYAGAEDTPYTRAVSALLMIAMVRRARKPGCKYDTMVIFEGGQGLGKSTLIDIIGGGWTGSGVQFGVKAREMIEALDGVLVMECEELAGLSNRDVNAIKAHITNTHDAGRKAYARTSVKVPRQSIFIGSTNDATYLRDSTGNRRFLPVYLHGLEQDDGQIRVDMEGLRGIIRQLHGEAAARETNGEAIYLPAELAQDAKVEQDKRTVIRDNEWYQMLDTLIGDRKGYIPADDLWAFMEVDAKDRNRYGKELHKVMDALGFAKGRMRRGDGTRPYVYVREDRDTLIDLDEKPGSGTGAVVFPLVA